MKKIEIRYQQYEELLAEKNNALLKAKNTNDPVMKRWHQKRAEQISQEIDVLCRTPLEEIGR